ncbi:MAG: cell wall synthesis protein CwsA [Mycobacterium sp.]
METDTDIRLTPARRLTRGLSRTAAGPVDITRGTLGLVAQSVGATFGGLRQQFRKSQARKELRRELADAKSLVAHEFADVKQAVQELAESKGGRGPRRKRLLIAAAGVTTLAGGAALFSTIRRSQRRPEPSPLPPSVPVEPKP